jgi:hypothetical protein
MEETLNTILLELQHINKGQQDLIEVQKELISRTEKLEKVQKKIVTTINNVNLSPINWRASRFIESAIAILSTRASS